MKTQFLVCSLGLLITTSCNQSRRENVQDSDTTKLRQQKTAMKTGAEKPDSCVYFINPNNGDELKSPVIVQMGVRGMTVEPAGKVDKGKGHHHIIIDGSFIEKGKVVPMNKTHLHFGKGQTSDTLKLAPGKHTLTLQFANGVHDSYGKVWSKTIEITIRK